jgi:hypothetical protein
VQTRAPGSMTVAPLPRQPHVAHGAPASDRSDLTVAVAPSSTHPRLVRIRVDEVAVGDLCFRTDASRDRVIDALVRHAGAEVRQERELITPHDPALFEPRPADPTSHRTTHRTIGGSA